MTMIIVAWFAFGLGTTLGFLLARSVENAPDHVDDAAAIKPVSAAHR